MRPVEPILSGLRPYFEANPDLTRILVNATSWFEASLALGVLADELPARALVTCANVREIVKELPRCPMPMSLDFESLARVWNLERDEHAWVRRFEHADGDYSIALLGDGNHLYDIVVRTGGRSLMLMPPDRSQDFVNAEVIDLMVERPAILGSVVDLTVAMGLPFYPMFYMSLEDWHQEYATAVFSEIVDEFDRYREPAVAEAARAAVPPVKYRTRRRAKKTSLKVT
ncbi:MAG: hypothetical protein ACYC1X_10700 [Coriobacteriia bacterium]